MSKLELGILKYSTLEKLCNFAGKIPNNEDGVEQFIKILPEFEAKTNEAMKKHLNDKYAEKVVPANATPSSDRYRSLFTDEGRAAQAVKQRTAVKASTKTTSEGFER